MATKLKIEKMGDEILKNLLLCNSPDIILEENHPMTISSTFSSY
jgi:hypothetical protein